VGEANRSVKRASDDGGNDRFSFGNFEANGFGEGSVSRRGRKSPVRMMIAIEVAGRLLTPDSGAVTLAGFHLV